MKWHLANGKGIVRSCEAGSLAEARVRLRPIPAEHFVASDITYRHGYKVAGTATPGPRVGVPRTFKTPEMVRARQARWRAKKRRLDPTYEDRRLYAQRMATSERLKAHAGAIVGCLVEGMAERDVAQRFGVAQQSVNNIRVLYAVPDLRAIKRKQREVLAWYLRSRGAGTCELKGRFGCSTKYLHSLTRLPYPVPRSA